MATALPAQRNAAEVWLMPVFIAKEGRGGEVRKALARLQSVSRNDPGCLEYTVFTDDQRSGTFVLLEGWNSRQDLVEHNDKSHVKDFVQMVTPLLAVPFSVTPLTPLA
ncbi:Quinol monooxygenase YgiN [Arthrobacter sp. 49Tsu3.1M3]|uniref:putative quinol monooxygenase n=1 Tax=Arthrobacter sp. 49Tsu3.1M3 TaxID=1279029 RepID=UPI0009D3EF8C|nr:putative quinol monooxygenase [Arthrobacter sp. 49Tsu3.1M3]SKC09177.1 Quinol monooxygenase YgiN [Arthrobacter sp. 49Tsu3.1M3]